MAMLSARFGESFGILARRIRATCRRRESLSSAARVDASWRDSISAAAAARSSWNPALKSEQGVDQFGDGERRRPFLDPVQGVVETFAEAVEDGIRQRLLAGEELVERPDRCTGPRGDLGHRDGVVTLLGKQGSGRLQQMRRPAACHARAVERGP